MLHPWNWLITKSLCAVAGTLLPDKNGTNDSPSSTPGKSPWGISAKAARVGNMSTCCVGAVINSPAFAPGPAMIKGTRDDASYCTIL